ncbi:MAG: hypothetical protein FWF29_01195 [Treponema sp.]|nr:hypothetical protein [Treponema sp.]
MLIYIRGSDRGSAVLATLILILVLSSLYISMIFRINVMEKSVTAKKNQIINSIETYNREVINCYELY